VARCLTCPKSFDITRPTLLLDEARARRNIERMARKARAAGVALRPHVKTHQSAVIADWFREHGVTGITVSSLAMAQRFAEAGWPDITVAFPLNVLELDAVNALAARVDLGLMLDAESTLSALARRIEHPVGVWIEIDTGYGRSGVPWIAIDRLLALARAVEEAPKLTLRGILTHSGETYHADTADAILEIHSRAAFRLAAIRRELTADAPGRPIKVSIGDTPGCSLAEDFTGIDEIRPGNFVFHDVMQWKLGACRDEDIAVAVACPVVGKYEDRIVIYGGAVHLSKDAIVDDGGRRLFGYLTTVDAHGLGRPIREAPVVNLSQEHGVIPLERPLLDSFSIGDVVCVLPVHACLACDLHPGYRGFDGKVIARKTGMDT